MDKKLKIALFSPLNPIRSGIADYTEELLYELSKHIDVDIYISNDYEPDNQDIKDRFPIYRFDKKHFFPESYDEIVFNMGNSYEPHIYMYEAIKEFSGIVVLHDYVLLGFYAGKYFSDGDFAEFSSIMKKYYSKKGEQIAEHLAKLLPKPIWDTEEGIEYPLNEEIISHSKALIVHSDYVRKKISQSWNKPIVTIPHHGHRHKEFDTHKIRKDLRLEDDDILIGSFGFINRNKRLHIIIPAVGKLNYPNLKYLILGEDGSNILRNLIDRKSGNIVVKNYAPLEEFEGLMNACDICINLR
jgi:glycosyltransferase involved in cell wall biosynthesis